MAGDFDESEPTRNEQHERAVASTDKPGAVARVQKYVATMYARYRFGNLDESPIDREEPESPNFADLRALLANVERDAEAVQVLGLRLKQVEAERDRLIESSIKLDVRLKATLAELDALRGPYSGAESFPARQANMAPLIGPVIRQVVKTEVVPSPARLPGDSTGK